MSLEDLEDLELFDEDEDEDELLSRLFFLVIFLVVFLVISDSMRIGSFPDPEAIMFLRRTCEDT